MRIVYITYDCGHSEGDPNEPGTKRRAFTLCAACAGKGESGPAVHAFREGFYPQLTGKDKIYFTSKKQLRAEADKRGMYSDYAH